jgi:hypothetical protein
LGGPRSQNDSDDPAADNYVRARWDHTELDTIKIEIGDCLVVIRGHNLGTLFLAVGITADACAPSLTWSRKAGGKSTPSPPKSGSRSLLTDQATQRGIDPVPESGEYFRARTNRAKSDDLRLHSIVFGILNREKAGAADRHVG